MAKFLIKQDLSKDDQAELARIEAKASGLRTTTEANFLTALAPYRTNRVLRWDTQLVQGSTNETHLSTDNILEAEGNTPTNGDSGFKHGAVFYDLDKNGNNVYVNTGDSDYAIWNQPMQTEIASGSASGSPSASKSASKSASFFSFSIGIRVSLSQCQCF